MVSYKAPGFQDRIAAASQAREKALNQLRAKAPLDEAVVAERKAARTARETREREKQAAKKATANEARANRASEGTGEAPDLPTEAERKAQRDARYAARKSRK